MISKSNIDACLLQSAASSRPSVPTFFRIILALCFLSLSPASLSDQTTTLNKISVHSEQESFQTETLECKGVSKSTVNGTFGTKAGILPQASAHLKTLGCLAPVNQIHDAWERDEVLVVDVRRSDPYQAFHIPGSLNLASFSIKSKHFLKHKRLILVNEGHYLSQLDNLCVQLESAGFQDVAVMQGGLSAWTRAGREINGNRLEASTLDQLSPADLIASLSEREWRILDLDEALSQTERILPESHVIEMNADSVRFIKAVNQAQRHFDPTVLNGFLVVSRDGKNYSRAAEILQLTEAKDIFYLSGGIGGFNQYIQTHTSLIERLSRGFREKQRCSG